MHVRSPLNELPMAQSDLQDESQPLSLDSHDVSSPSPGNPSSDPTQSLSNTSALFPLSSDHRHFSTGNTHPLCTCSKFGISKPFQRLCLHTHVMTECEPSSYFEAVKHAHWCQVINTEFQALKHQGIWILVPPNST